MAADKNLIKETLNITLQNSGAAIFSLGEFYVQTAAVSENELYCEAVSHHYHNAVDIGLENKFQKMGFHLEEGGNYSRKYRLNGEYNIEKVSDEIVYIFENVYAADTTQPFEITEL